MYKPPEIPNAVDYTSREAFNIHHASLPMHLGLLIYSCPLPPNLPILLLPFTSPGLSNQRGEKKLVLSKPSINYSHDITVYVSNLSVFKKLHYKPIKM